MRAPFRAGLARIAPIAAVIAALAPLACRSAGTPPPGDEKSGGPRIESLGPDVQLIQVTPDVWIHVTDDKTEPWGSVPANGMLLLDERDSLLIDTGWNASQTKRILRFADEILERPVRRVLVTHGHADRIGGVWALTSSITVYAQAETARKLEELGVGLALESFTDELSLEAASEKIEVFYPGPGHARDNVVVWLPDEKILFAGCLVKSKRADDFGNREDAVLRAWPRAVLRVLERYGKAELIVPGHGPPGRLDLVTHTLSLLERALSPSSLQ